MMVDIEPEWNWASVDYFWKLHYNFLLKCKYLHVKNYIHLYKVHLLIYKINIYSILRFTYILTLYIIYLPVCVLSSFSLVWLFTTLWTVARQSPLSMGFSRQECWSGIPGPHPGDLPNSGIEPWASYISCPGRQILYH